MRARLLAWLELAPLMQRLFTELRISSAGDPLVATHLMITLRRVQESGAGEALQQAAESEVGHLLKRGIERLDPVDHRNLLAASRQKGRWE